MLIGIGQLSHQFTSRLTIWSAGYKVRSITALEEEKALSTGAEFISESFLLIVSGGIVIWEYQRSRVSQQKKDEKHRAVAKAERMALQAKLHALDVRVKALEVVVKQNSESILNIGGAKYVAPQDTVPIDDDDDNDDEDDEATSEKESEKRKENGALQVAEKIRRLLPMSKSTATPTPEQEQQTPQPASEPESITTTSSEASAPPFAAEVATAKPWWRFW